nr:MULTISPECIES: serpin family protein [unclassified Prevotella]
MGLPNASPNAEFHANRPFIYIITGNTSGGIYFIGTFK